MNRKMEAVARHRNSQDSVWLVAGMRVKAPGVYEALFVNSPFGRYRECAVYAVMEKGRSDYELLGDEFLFLVQDLDRYQKPEYVYRLLEEISPLVGEVELEKTGCQACGELRDVDELEFSDSCCESLLCRQCRFFEGETCGACRYVFTPVEVLAMLADD